MKSEMNDSTIFDQNEYHSKTKQNLSKELDANSITISKVPKSDSRTGTDEISVKKLSGAASQLKKIISNKPRWS
jgi:hypothetical protein